MALYRNIAGAGAGIGKTIPDAYFTKYDDPGGGGGGFYPALNAAPVASNQVTDVVFYDPGFVAVDQAYQGYPSEQVVYDVRENEPVIPIQEMQPIPAMEVQTTAVDPAPIATTVQVPNELSTKNMLPLLTLALLAVTMVEGESLFGNTRNVVFAGGLGLLYLQFNKRADTPAL